MRGYNYTNSRAFRSMTDGYQVYGKRGLLNVPRFANFGIGGLPYEAYGGIIEAFLEPEPESWTKNKEFPDIWPRVIGSVCRTDSIGLEGQNIILLSFPILPSDKAYVFERAYRQRELLLPKKESTKKTESDSYLKMWKSRVKAADYKGDYSLPELGIWNPIEQERLKVEWTRPVKDVFERAKQVSGYNQ